MLTLRGGQTMKKQSLITVKNQIDLTDFLENVEIYEGTLTYKDYAINESALPIEDTFDLAIYPIFKTQYVLAYSLSNGWLAIPELNGELNYFGSISIQPKSTSLKEQWLLEQFERLQGYLTFLSEPQQSQEYLLLLIKEYEHDKSVIDIPSLTQAIQLELEEIKQLYKKLMLKDFPLLKNELAPALFI